jgi:hypothetical protein
MGAMSLLKVGGGALVQGDGEMQAHDEGTAFQGWEPILYFTAGKKKLATDEHG